MAKRTTGKVKAKGGASKSASKRRATASTPKSRKKAPATRAGGAIAAAASKGIKRRSVASTTASGVKAKKPASARKRSTRATGTKSAPTHRKVTDASPPDATSQDPIQFPEQKKLPKTHLTAKELRGFRDLLLRKRTELVGNLQGLADEALHGDGHARGDRSAMPIHMADLGSDNWEQEFTLGLLESEQELVREIDDALSRIADKTYGVCAATHGPISMARLRAKPWAKYCIEYARAREEGRAL